MKLMLRSTQKKKNKIYRPTLYIIKSYAYKESKIDKITEMHTKIHIKIKGA